MQDIGPDLLQMGRILQGVEDDPLVAACVGGWAHRLLKKAHLRRSTFGGYPAPRAALRHTRMYASHLAGYPSKDRCAAFHLDLFEQSGRKRVFQQPASDARAELVEFAEKLSIPVAVTMNGKEHIADDQPLPLGSVGTYGRRAANQIVAEADHVFLAGSRAGGPTTNNWKLPPPGSRTIQLGCLLAALRILWSRLQALPAPWSTAGRGRVRGPRAVPHARRFPVSLRPPGTPDIRPAIRYV